MGGGVKSVNLIFQTGYLAYSNYLTFLLRLDSQRALINFYLLLSRRESKPRR
jgi:hypothetical protein